MNDFSPFRLAGVVYVLYFFVGAGSSALGRWDIGAIMRGSAAVPARAVWIASTLIYAILVVLLTRLVWRVDPGVALAATILGLVGCAIQSANSVIGVGRNGPLAALFFFGLFMALYGWLMIRSAAMPNLIGMLFVVSGIGWCSLAIPGFPNALGVLVFGLGSVAEVALAAWLLVRG